MKVALVDLGCGNTGSVSMALERLGIEFELTTAPEMLGAADKVLLPGVGAAGYAMEQMHRLGLTEVLRALERPALGICLGMQLLFEQSQEDDGVPTLGVIPGSVRRLDPEPGRPVPHMGWSQLEVTDENLGIASGEYVYFAHSFACDDGPATLARAQYGRSIPAIVRKGNWTGAQFHPERSGTVGARFLESWLNS